MKTFSLALAALATTLCCSLVRAAPAPLAADASQTQTIGLQGAMPDFTRVDVQSPHVYDYTFASAPTDWRVQSGIWEMTNRWACSPGWSWFGGRSDEIAAIWNKRKFTGDVSVQFYFAFKMENSGTFDSRTSRYRWWEYPSDAAVTIGGDGINLSSGYSFIIGAQDNSHTILKRGTQVIGDTNAPENMLPGYYDSMPDQQISRTIHRRWWYARIDKIGSKVLCYLDNKLIFSYDDPNPLDAGQIAVWTYNNGIMLSRVQIYYDKEIKPVYSKAVMAKAPAKARSLTAQVSVRRNGTSPDTFARSNDRQSDAHN